MSRERLVDLDDVHVGQRETRASQRVSSTPATGPSPMTRGSTPAAPAVTMRASGVAPALSPAVFDPTINAAAPSLMPEALPAVTMPMPFSTIGLSFASVSRVVPGLGCSSFGHVRRLAPLWPGHPHRVELAGKEALGLCRRVLLL